jgi:hypothetical protein
MKTRGARVDRPGRVRHNMAWDIVAASAFGSLTMPSGYENSPEYGGPEPKPWPWVLLAGAVAVAGGVIWVVN